MASRLERSIDDPLSFSSLDPSGLGERIGALPNHCRAAWDAAHGCPLPSDWRAADRVVVGGMGGSAMAGELASDLAAGRGAAPILVVRDRRLPFALDRRTLFVVCSYSGNTEETLSLYDQAQYDQTHGQAAGEQAMILVLRGGGALAERAEAHGVTRLAIDVAAEPRSAVGYNLMLLLGVLSRLGLLEISEEEAEAGIEAASHGVASLGPDVPAAHNPAKQLALDLIDRLVLIYGCGLFGGMARRWKTQLNENAKVWAYFETVPELLHNSVEAYSSPFPFDDRVMALLLQPSAGPMASAASSSGEADYGRHNQALSELLRRNGLPHRVVTGSDAAPLAQLLNMLLLGDYVSYYLAMLRGVDPSPNPCITAAKQLLAVPPEDAPEA